MNGETASPDVANERPALRAAARDLLRQAVRSSMTLFKVMIPVSIVTRILAQFGVVEWIGRLLAPLMILVGLPGSMGLVWATTAMTNLYGGLAVFVTLGPETSLTGAQMTVLTTMMLIAHALPLEVGIARAAGARVRVILLVRVLGALACGIILNAVYRAGGWLGEPARVLWDPGQPDPSWAGWAVGLGRNLGMVFAIVLVLLTFLKILEVIGITRLLTGLLKPVLRLIGIGPEAAPITILGMLLGISYGGGLIVSEARSGRVSHRDILSSLFLMSLSHSVIEDSLLMMMALGGHISGVLWGRLLFSLAVTAVFARLVARLPDERFERQFFVVD